MAEMTDVLMSYKLFHASEVMATDFAAMPMKNFKRNNAVLQQMPNTADNMTCAVRTRVSRVCAASLINRRNNNLIKTHALLFRVSRHGFIKTEVFLPLYAKPCEMIEIKCKTFT